MVIVWLTTTRCSTVQLTTRHTIHICHLLLLFTNITNIPMYGVARLHLSCNVTLQTWHLSPQHGEQCCTNQTTTGPLPFARRKWSRRWPFGSVGCQKYAISLSMLREEWVKSMVSRVGKLSLMTNFRLILKPSCCPFGYVYVMCINAIH